MLALLCSVAVGYIYEDCATQPYWEVQSAMIAGNDMMSSEIGGWNVDVHHVYSTQEGSLSQMVYQSVRLHDISLKRDPLTEKKARQNLKHRIYGQSKVLLCVIIVLL